MWVKNIKCLLYAEVAKLVDALALGASGAIHGGSSPLLGTKTRPESDSFRVVGFCSRGEDLKRAKFIFRSEAKKNLSERGHEFLVKMSWSEAETKFSFRTGDQVLFILNKTLSQSDSFRVVGFCS